MASISLDSGTTAVCKDAFMCTVCRNRRVPKRGNRAPGKEAKLCLMGHALRENRNGLVVAPCLTEANGHAERIAALGGQERTKFRGRERAGWAFIFAAAANNLARLPKLLEASA